MVSSDTFLGVYERINRQSCRARGRPNDSGQYAIKSMTQYKNQHYVPRSYLRHFSNDGVGLCRYSLANEASERSNVERMCASFYFYVDRSASEEWETTFSRLETKHAEIIQKILADRSLTIFSAKAKDDQASLQDFLFLCNFILLTATRTKLKKKEVHSIINFIFDMMKPGIAQSEEAQARGITEEALDRLELRRDTANLESMEKALVDAPLISDLTTRILINETEKPFITSDSPTVFYNFLKLGDLSMIGWQSPGLMLFLPLSEEIMLWLFDSGMYEPNTKMEEQTLYLKRHQDIDELNRLQILNADEYLIFSKPEYHKYVSSLHKPLRSRSRSELIRAEKMAEFDVGNERHEIHRVGLIEINYKPHLSFFRIDKTYVASRMTAYKEHVAAFGPARPFFRNEALFAAHYRNKERYQKHFYGIQ